MRTVCSVIRTLNLNKNLTGERADLLNKMNSAFHTIKPFVFDESELSSSSGISKPMYLPFKFCSFDFIRPIVFHSDKFIEKCKELGGVNSFREVKSLLLAGFIVFENEDLSLDETIVMFDEFHFLSNKRQDFSSLNSSADRALIISLNYKDYSHFNARSLAMPFLKALADKSFKTGESVNGLRIKRGREPEFVKRLVVISKRTSQKTSLDCVGKVDWKHQWRVRGHWRKISQNMIGKDREGNYAIVGHTWVKDFIKGDGPLIEKTRIIKGEVCQELTR
jgi:hypothetical protein